MLCALLLALAAPVEVRVLPFTVPEGIHDGVKLEVKRWPKLWADASKAGDAVRFVDGPKEGTHTMQGRVSVEADGEKLVIEARVYDGRRLLWGERYEMTEFAKKVEFLDTTKARISAGVKKALAGKKP